MAVLNIALGAVSIVLVTVGCTVSDRSAIPTTPSARSSSTTPTTTPYAGLPVSPEPTPYTVPTTPATDHLEVVTPTSHLVVRPGEQPVPWRLIRLYDGGKNLAIFYAFGCNDPLRVQVVETDTSVAILVLHPTRNGPMPMCLSTYRKAITLARPLGQRALLHVG